MLAAVASALGILAIGLGAVSPETHEHVHADADHPEHACAITLAALGYCDTAAPAPAVLDTRAARRTAVHVPPTHAWSTPDFWLVPSHGPPPAAA